MLAGQLIEPGRMKAVTIDDPATPLAAGAALVRIRKAGVCGSDIHMFRHGRIGELLGRLPMTIGHEAMGVVQAVADDVDPGLVGRRVAIEPTLSCGRCEFCLRGDPNLCTDYQFVGLPPHPGVMQQFLVHPARLLEPIPDAMTDAQAVMLEPLAIALWATDLGRVRAGSSAAVLGTGVLGGLTLMLLAHMGCRPIVCSDLLADRVALARELGATVAVDATREDAVEAVNRVTGGRGVDAVFECCGADQTNGQMVHAAAPGGRCVVIGINDDDRLAFPHGIARRKGLDIRMVRRSRLTLHRSIELIVRDGLPVERLVTHHLPLADVQRAFDMVAAHSDGVIKALVEP
ncbi:MAG: Sorbitol dehydrogenase [Phycisphaerae bacterium]|nr:Sorbitol dehydrogenase [Phycisphaerae bacterium]